MPPFANNTEQIGGPASWDYPASGWDARMTQDASPHGSQDFLLDIDEDLGVAPMTGYGADQLHDSGIIDEDDPGGLFQDIPAPQAAPGTPSVLSASWSRVSYDMMKDGASSLDNSVVEPAHRGGHHRR